MKTKITLFTIVIAIFLTGMWFALKPKTYVPPANIFGVVNVECVDLTDVGIESAITTDTDIEIDNIDDVEHDAVVDNRNAFERRFAHVIAESMATSNTWIGPLVRQTEKGEWEKYICTNTTPISISIDPDIPEVAEYIQIAFEEGRKIVKIPDGIKPTVKVRGDCVYVRYPWSPPPGMTSVFGSSYYAIIEIDIKTKKVLSVS